MAEQFEMQSSLGLAAPSNVMAGTPTQPLAMPQTIHPGQFAAMASQQAAIQSQNTARMTMMFVPSALAAAPMTSGLPAALGGGNPAAMSMAQQFSDNYSAMQGSRAPLYSYGLGATSGLAGLPSPGMMTAPEFGVYRSAPPPPMSAANFGPMVRPSVFNPLVFSPLTEHFVSPLQGMQTDTTARLAQNIGGVQTAGSFAVQAGAAVAASAIGSSVFGTAGALLGGPLGAVAGTQIGAVAGPVLSQLSGLPQRMGDLATSSITSALMPGLQAQQLTRAIFNAGPALAPSGMGLNYDASSQMGQELQRMGYQRKTGMNTADVSMMTEGATALGLMNDVSGVEQGAQRLRQVARAVKELMRVTNDPDVSSAMRELASMRNMGAEISSAMDNFKAIRGYARMSGTSVRGIQDAANMGGLMYQGMGLPAATGSVFGAGATAMARQAVATGTFPIQTLAMLGGEQGVAQRTMEAGLAYMRMPMMAAYGAHMMPGGGFIADRGAVSQLAGGRVSLNDMVYGGLVNMSQAIGKGGLGALANFLAQQGEIQDSMAQQLGPIGVSAVQKLQVIDAMKMLGVKGAGGFQLAAQSMLGDAQLARQLTMEVTNPEYTKSLYAQSELEIQNRSAENAQLLRTQPGPGIVSKLIGDPFFGERFEESFITGAAPTAFNRLFRQHARNAERREAMERGGDLFQVNPAMLPTSAMAANLLATTTPSQDVSGRMASLRQQMGAIAARNSATTVELDAAEREILAKSGGGMGAYFSGISQRSYAIEQYLGRTNVAQDRRRLTDTEEAGRVIGAALGATLNEVKADAAALRGTGLSQAEINQMTLGARSDLTALIKSKVRLGGAESLTGTELDQLADNQLLQNPTYQGADQNTQMLIKERLKKMMVRTADFTAAPALRVQPTTTTTVSGANRIATQTMAGLQNLMADAGRKGIQDSVFLGRGASVLKGSEDELAYLNRFNELANLTPAQKELIAIQAGMRAAAPGIKNQLETELRRVTAEITAADGSFDFATFTTQYAQKIHELSASQGPAQRLAMTSLTTKGDPSRRLQDLLGDSEALTRTMSTQAPLMTLLTADKLNIPGGLFNSITLEKIREKAYGDPVGAIEDIIKAGGVQRVRNDPKLKQAIEAVQGATNPTDKAAALNRVLSGMQASSSTFVSATATQTSGPEIEARKAVAELSRVTAAGGGPNQVLSASANAFAAGVGLFHQAAQTFAGGVNKTAMNAAVGSN